MFSLRNNLVNAKKYYEKVLELNPNNEQALTGLEKTNEEIFDSIAEAARAKGIKYKTNISTVAKGKAKTAGGFHWKYAEEVTS